MIASLRASLVPLLVDEIVIGYLTDWSRRTHKACDGVFLPYYQQKLPREAASDRKRRSSTSSSTSASDPRYFSKKKKRERFVDETVKSKPLSSPQPPTVVQRRAHSDLISSIQAERQK